MPRIRCHYTDCVFVDDGFCSAASVEFDQETGCVTYNPMDGVKDDDILDEDEMDEMDEEDLEEGEEDWEDDDDEEDEY